MMPSAKEPARTDMDEFLMETEDIKRGSSRSGGARRRLHRTRPANCEASAAKPSQRVRRRVPDDGVGARRRP
jgi:hypothetical protein